MRVQVPAALTVTTPALVTVHFAVVDEVKVTGRVEVAVAVTENGAEIQPVP
jgi:hypothetical protein